MHNGEERTRFNKKCVTTSGRRDGCNEHCNKVNAIPGSCKVDVYYPPYTFEFLLETWGIFNSSFIFELILLKKKIQRHIKLCCRIILGDIAFKFLF